MEFSDKAVRCGSEDKGDLLVTLEICRSGMRVLEINSKVKRLYGEAIRNSVLEILDAYAIESANVLICDQGALDFAVRARMITAVKRALQKEGKQDE